MMIRFFAEVAPTSPVTKHALAIAGRLAELVTTAGSYRAAPLSLRIIASAGVLQLFGGRSKTVATSPWSPLSGYFSTPLEASFVTVVCTEPQWWGKFWTRGSRNVLVAPPAHAQEAEKFMAAPPTVRTPGAPAYTPTYDAWGRSDLLGVAALRKLVFPELEPELDEVTDA